MLFGEKTNAGENQISAEAQSLIMESVLLDNLNTQELTAFLENHTEVQAALRDEVVMEKTIVRLDKQAKLSRATKVATFTIAKERNDPLFKKLLTVWRMERFLEAQLLKKYQGQAVQRARQAVQRSANSSSQMVKKVSNNVHRQLNSPAAKPAQMKAPSQLSRI